MTTEQALWYRRWQAIDNMIDLLEKRYEREFTQEDSSNRENTLLTLIHELRKFATGQFRFFYDGFYTKQFVDLAPIPDLRTFAFPRYITGHTIEDHILQNTLRQIAEDAIVIQRASEQRMIALLGSEKGIPNRVQILEALEDVDKLARAALQVIEPYLKHPQHQESEHAKQTAITYFHRSANVRVIPYAPVAMIGIPITTVGLNHEIGVIEDLLAIPHEVAHHLYWNGWAASGERIHAELAARISDNLVSHWQQEIFADVIGCVIGGPAVARSFIDLQLTAIAAEFLHADDPHPTPALRPLIYAYALEQLGDTKSAGAVRDEWQTHLNRRNTFVNRERLFAAYEIVDAILGTDNGAGLIDRSTLPLSLRWSTDEDEYNQLYPTFAGRIRSLTGAVAEDALDPQDFNMQTDWRIQAAALAQQPALASLPGEWTDPKAKLTASTDDRIPVEAAGWLHIYDAGGWITAGPGPKQIGD